MATTSELDRVTAIVLRFMRRPILVLIVVYAIAISGLVLIPGQDAEGNPTHMSIFHAFYFLTYTATTTGFGEIPHPFTDAQRLWAIVLLYGSVVAWIYAISSISLRSSACAPYQCSPVATWAMSKLGRFSATKFLNS